MLENKMHNYCDFKVIQEIPEFTSSPLVISEIAKMNNPTSISPAIQKISSPNLNELSPSFKSNLQKLMSKKHTESTSVINVNPIQLRIDSILKKNNYLKSKYSKYTVDRLKIKHKRLTLCLLLIDLFSAISNIIVVTWMYFDHFVYNRTFSTSEENNIARFVCLCISLAVCCFLIITIKVKANLEEVKYLLSRRSKRPKSRFKLRVFMFEVLLHIIQPYPYLDYHWHMKVIGNPVTYSVNMILFFLCMLRLYVLLKVMKYWNLYSNDNSRRIFKFFQNKLLDLFFYKANLKRYGFICVLFIFGVFIYFGSLIFKVFENYTNTEEETFGLIWNCFWFLIQSMTGIGYGEILPTTLIGRIITIFWCIYGMFLLSLLVVILTSFITLDELELKAYSEINLSYDKKVKEGYVKTYLNSMVKYKFYTLRSGDNNYLLKWLNRKEEFKINKEKYLVRLLASIRKQMTIVEFCNIASDKWENFYVDLIDEIENNIYSIAPCASDFINNLYSYTKDIRNSKAFSFRNLNMVKYMSQTECAVEIKNITELRSDCIFNRKMFRKKMKELIVMCRNRNVIEQLGLRMKINLHPENEVNRKDRSKYYSSPPMNIQSLRKQQNK